MKEKYLYAWMDCLERFAQTSEAKRLKVAAFLFKNDNMVSHAINGTPEGWETNECEDKVYLPQECGGWIEPQEVKEKFPFEDDLGRYYLKTKEVTLHAEEQCLEKMRLSHETTEACVMLVGVSPCLRCAIKIKSAKVKKVYYREVYRDTSGLDYLISQGVEVEKV